MQPPAGGCVLKPFSLKKDESKILQPPSGGCVLKRKNDLKLDLKQEQPPSGGCVLKRTLLTRYWKKSKAAAFGRLCVETL